LQSLYIDVESALTLPESLEPEQAQEESQEQDELDVSPPPPEDGRWTSLSRYPVGWFLLGAILTALPSLLFFQRLRCVFEYRVSEAMVALAAVLGIGVGMAFRFTSPRTRTVLGSLYGGFAVAAITVIAVTWFLPPPLRADCPVVGDTAVTPGPSGETTDGASPSPAAEIDLEGTAMQEKDDTTSTPVPGPTLGPTPITATTSLSPSAVILSPSDGEHVSIRNEVRGQVSNLRANYRLWLLVQASAETYYPQTGPIEIDPTGGWVAPANVGNASPLEWERPYTITAVIASPEASQEFSSFLNTWPKDSDKGLMLPDGSTVLDRVRVIRTNPIVTLTSHESQVYVGSHETLKGTYLNMKPGDWLLYGIVELGNERFVPYGPFEPQTGSGAWAIDVIFPWPTDGARDIFFHTLAVLASTHADEILRSSVGSPLSAADLSADDWNVILGPVTQLKLTCAERIAFASDKPGNDDIFVINADGTGLLRLTDDQKMIWIQPGHPTENISCLLRRGTAWCNCL
jgi:hypothetical protein